MNYEEKYKEALEDMRAIYPNLKGDAKLAVEHAFPELAESEDERTREWLLDYFRSVGESWIHRDITPEQIIAYLEKQKEQNLIMAKSPQLKEQKPYTDFVIKPHKGDDNNPYDMRVSEAQEYAIKRGFGVPFNDGEVYVDERHMTQTIGNIIRWADEHPKEQKPWKVGANAYFTPEQKPADLSEMMVHKEPYIAPIPTPMVADEQKPAEWSEEDEEMLEYIIGDVNDAKQLYTTQEAKDMADKEISWLKSLRPLWKPSEVHLSALLAIFNDPNNIGSQTCQLALTDLYEQLKKL